MYVSIYYTGDNGYISVSILNGQYAQLIPRKSMLKSNPFWFHVLHEEIPAYTPLLISRSDEENTGYIPDIKEALSLLALLKRSMEAMG